MSDTLADRLRRLIAAEGPIPVHAWMAACAAHYYARAPFGRDFATAPELTQVFGELLGLWAADLWDRAGRPEGTRLVELGPGRGTMMADALRAAARVGFAPPVNLVETSRQLIDHQRSRTPGAVWHETLSGLPDDAPMIVIGNEFLDALPIIQLVRVRRGWHERCVALDGNGFVPVAGAKMPTKSLPASPGAIFEVGFAANAVVQQVGRRLASQGGAALFIDYGYVEQASFHDTLQAMRDGVPVSPWANPGEADITAHVNFGVLPGLARMERCIDHGPVSQGAFLARLGLHERTDALARANPAKAAALRAATMRLSHPGHMGALFQVFAFTAPGWPAPAGF